MLTVTPVWNQCHRRRQQQKRARYAWTVWLHRTI